MPGFIAPSSGIRLSFIAAMEEFRAEGRGSDADLSMIGQGIREHRGDWADPERFAEYVRLLREDARPAARRPPGYVPCTTLWWVAGTEFIGRLAIRHQLTRHLLEVGGHIGYDVRPAARRRGHATAMLRGSLPVARGLGIDRALLTCDVDNIGSRKVIEANGGLLEDERSGKLRFWVPTG